MWGKMKVYLNTAYLSLGIYIHIYVTVKRVDSYRGMNPGL